MFYCNHYKNKIGIYKWDKIAFNYVWYQVFVYLHYIHIQLYKKKENVKERV